MSLPADVDEHTPCAACGTAKQMHYLVKSWVCAEFVRPPDEPEPHERVPALTVTYWTCHACGAQQDVWGTGAIDTWMDCQRPGCGASSFTDLTLGINVATGEATWTPPQGDNPDHEPPQPHKAILDA